jgi:hypothetical protein
METEGERKWGKMLTVSNSGDRVDNFCNFLIGLKVSPNEFKLGLELRASHLQSRCSAA